MEFKEMYLIDCVNDIIDYRGKTPKKLKDNWSEDGDYRAISAKNIKNMNLVNQNSMNKAKASLYKKWMKKEIDKGDILLTSEAPLGETLYWDFEEKIILSQRVFGIKANNEIVNSKYLFAYMQTPFFKHELFARESGTTVTGIRRKELEKVIIKVPSMYIQNYIGQIIYNINYKINNNNKIIANLEELSQTLFKRWFVDFEFPDKDGNPYKSSGGEMVDSELGEIPKEWQVVKLETLIDNVKDRINAKSVSNNFPYVPIDLIPKRKLTFYNYKDGKEAKSSLIKFKRNDILLGNMRVYFHRVCLAPFEGVTRNTVFTLRPKDEKYTYYLINLINKDEFIEYASNNSKGSTMPYAVWEGVLDKIKVIKPPFNYLNQFNSKIKSNFELSISLLEQNRKLAILRDTLLPKLMSGKVEIPNDIEVNSDEFSI